MPCIAIGPEEEEDEDQPPAKIVWATSCAVGSGSAAAPQEVSGGAAGGEEQEQDEDGDAPTTPSTWCNKRVVFLEIDGILNTRPDPRMVHVEKMPCVQLRRLLDASDAEVVLTSRWRRHHEYVHEVLKNFGALPESRKELHRAPWNAKPERRDLEILQWVNAHRDIAGWVVLDARDLLRFASAPRLQGHTIQVNPIEGLTGDVVAEALRLMGCDKPASRGAAAKPPEHDFSAPSRSNFSATHDFNAPVVGLAIPGTSPAVLQARGTGAKASPSDAVETGLASRMRSALSWDSELSGKMEALLGSLPRVGDGKEALTQDTTLFPQNDASRDEFEAVIAAAREKFKK